MNNSTSPRPDYLYRVLGTTDHVFRYYCFIVHLVFIVVLMFSPQIRTKNMLYANHATIMNICYPITFLIFIPGPTINYPDPKINQILCSIIGYYREFSYLIRPYSILIIAIYRYIGVFHLTLFDRINNSYVLLLTPIGLAWLISIVLPIIITSVLKTKESAILCLSGQSESVLISVLYFVINYSIQVFIPNTAIIVIYVKIMRHLKRIQNKIKPRESLWTSSLTGSTDGSRTRRVSRLDSHKEKSFALHFFLMCASVLLTSAVFAVFYQNNVMPNYFVVLYYWLPVLRVIVLTGFSLIPIISLYFHPSRPRLFKYIKKLVICNK